MAIGNKRDVALIFKPSGFLAGSGMPACQLANEASL